MPQQDSLPTTCPSCQTLGALKRHARREAWWRDVPQAGRPQVRRGWLTRWRCGTCGLTHTTAPEWAASPRRMTRDLAQWIEAHLAAGHKISHIAQTSGIDHKTVRTLRPQAELRIASVATMMCSEAAPALTCKTSTGDSP